MSLGQVGFPPSQCSGASHLPTDGRQFTVIGAQTSLGQAPLVPLQVSATSHLPTTALQTTPLAMTVHVPSMSPPASFEQAWQSLVPPVQAVPQHTPSAQKPELQEAPRWQAEPSLPTQVDLNR